MNALIGFAALIAVGLVGWAIAEFKYKAFTSPVQKRTSRKRKSLKSRNAQRVSRR